MTVQVANELQLKMMISSVACKKTHHDSKVKLTKTQRKRRDKPALTETKHLKSERQTEALLTDNTYQLIRVK